MIKQAYIQLSIAWYWCIVCTSDNKRSSIPINHIQRTISVFLHTLYQALLRYIGGNSTTNALKSIIYHKRSLLVSSHGHFNRFGHCHCWCLLDCEMSFAPFVASWVLRVAYIVSHKPCRTYYVASIMSRIPCRINHVACSCDMCIHATQFAGDILRFIRCQTLLTKKFDTQ